tara:strand:- start:217 stop:618 length:402 start_codon:yes stop_codon:yes gene_type:complete
MTIYGPMWPLRNGENDAFQLNEKRSQQAAFELKNLILTSPGENLSDFDYGVGLRNFLFDQNTRSNKENLKNVIRSQIFRYVDMVSLNSVVITQTDEMVDSNQISVKLNYTVIGEPLNEELEINFSTNQGGIFQ